MIDHELGRAIAFSLPSVCAIVCLALTALDVGRAKHPVLRRIYCRMIETYSIVALVWLGLVLHAIAHEAFVWFIPLFVPLIMVGYVFFYRLICVITDTGEKAHCRSVSGAVYFIAPVFAAIVLLVRMLTVSPEAHIETIYHGHGGLILPCLMVICLTYSLLCLILGVIELKRYRNRMKGRAANSHRTALIRLFWAAICEIVVLPVPILGLLLGFRPFIDGGLVWIVAVLPSFTIYLVLCGNILSDNYMIVESDSCEDHSSDGKSRPSRRRIEQYMETVKPYLDPAFRISRRSRASSSRSWTQDPPRKS